MSQMLLDWTPRRRIVTVSELNASLRALLEEHYADLWVAGEISSVRISSSGHCYFTLKDAGAQLKCACYKSALRLLRFKPRDGVEVLARGRLDVYAERGEYQLIVEALEPRGYGALQLAFEQLKQKLAAEGLFDPARKRPLPKFPARIGIVTSPTGAAIQDLLTILTRRFPGLHIRLYPAQVQGEGSVEQVCAGLDYFSRRPWADVVIVARGGGSLEDLWTFNEEPVARSIAACSVPVVSAIGHDTDFTIADFAADLRAPTPSAAAELVVPLREQVLESVAALGARAAQAARFRLLGARRRLDGLGTDRAATLLHRAIARRQQRIDDLELGARDSLRQLMAARRRGIESLDARLRQRDLRLRLAAARARLDAAAARLGNAVARRVEAAGRRLAPLQGQLTQLSPLAVLERGYAIVETPDRRIVKDAAKVSAGDALRVRLNRGRLAVQVTGREEPA